MLRIKKKSILLILVTSFFYNLSVILFSFLLMNIIDKLSAKNYVRFKDLICEALIVIIAQIVLFALYNLVRGQITKLQMIEIRASMLNGILKFNISHFHEQETDEYVSFFYNDLGYLKEKYIYRIYDLIENIGMFIMATIGIIWIYPYYIFAILIMIAVALLLPMFFTKKSVYFMSHITEKSKNQMMWLQNIFKGFDVIKSFKIESKIASEGRETISEYENSEYEFDLFMNFVQVGLNFTLTILTLLTYIIGGYLVIEGHITIGALIVLAQLLFKVAAPVMTVTTAFNDINSTKDIRDKLKMTCEYIPPKKDLSNLNKKIKDILVLDHLTFTYPGQKKTALKNIDLKFITGKKYAVVGENGCGKSTLIKLLTGYYENYSGNISFFGKELREIADEILFDNVSYISQDSFIFNKSIKDNIFVSRYDENEKEKAYKYMKQLNFLPVLEKHPDGMEYLLDPSENLSGGEIQKISIIRALIKKCKILFVDEGDANLDKDSRQNLYELIDKEDYNLVVIITHHLEKENSKFFDEIICMAAGKVISITESGNH